MRQGFPGIALFDLTQPVPVDDLHVIRSLGLDADRYGFGFIFQCARQRHLKQPLRVFIERAAERFDHLEILPAQNIKTLCHDRPIKSRLAAELTVQKEISEERIHRWNVCKTIDT